MRFCDVWTINLHLSLTLKRKTKGRDVIRIRISPAYRYQLTKIHIGPGGWYVYYKERCMWKKTVFIISNNCLLDGIQVIVKDTEIQTVFALWGWKACGVCYIIVVLANDDGKQMKLCVTLIQRNIASNSTTADSLYFDLICLCF